MKFTGQNILHAPVDRAWDALLDPGVLVRTIPGCERLEATGDNAYAMTVTAGVASIKGTYAGSCVLAELRERESLVMKLDGAGAPGTIGATVDVRFTDAGDGTTTVSYDADAIVGGMIGGVGQRMLTSVSRRMAGEFFGNVDAVLAGAAEAPPAAVAAVLAGEAGAPGAPTVGQVFTAPPPAVAAAPSRQDFLLGVAVGAGLVAIGVLIGRRR
ncbi:SRPBCC family protein [Nocardioides sediminis]|uniref:SRPBCC family protein n=1 Tax=Nocardioides sediminis TaxID=433648 RepID=UPI000D31C185|nr:carbon monoxide dehydrogenase subunit G [Nocardioides sediminis]